MGSRTSPPCHEPTDALRARSEQELREALTRYMSAAEPDASKDYRAGLVGFAPFFDCAQRLEVDPVGLFEEASVGRGALMRELASTFARRADVTLAAFGWRLVERPGGPCYCQRARRRARQVHFASNVAWATPRRRGGLGSCEMSPAVDY